MRTNPGKLRAFAADMSAPRFEDTRTIALEDASELEYWIKHLDKTKDELLAAISEVGFSAQRVKDVLRRKPGGSLPTA